MSHALFQKTYTDSNFHRHDNHGEMKTHLVQEHHEPIISRELFEKAGTILSQRAKERGIQKGTAKYQQRYAFSGRIICGQCGDKFKRQTYTSGITWACKTLLFHTQLFRCHAYRAHNGILLIGDLTSGNGTEQQRQQQYHQL